MLTLLAAPVGAEPPKAARVTATELGKEISENRVRTPEFERIKEEASRRGVRVWLFGGSAASYAQYVKSDLEFRKTGQPDHLQRFDYDFSNIFRSTQDIDVVVDGDAEKCYEFQSWLTETYPYFTGSADEQWEVRSLRERIGEKEPLLGNSNFLDQHTDSHSVGMIELTDSKEPVVRDLFAWNQKNAPFLQSVAKGEIEYRHSKKHELTSRYLEGKNPPILSVIRFLTKAFQFDLKIREKDLVTIKKVIAEFVPSRGADPYVVHWLEKNGHKLMTHSVDVSLSWRTLEKLGLRAKLIDASTRFGDGELGFWLNKEPLWSSKDSRRLTSDQAWKGKTAKELGLTTVTHATRDFVAYEAIRRAPSGIPNFFISRSNEPSEKALYGPGLYTAIGEFGHGQFHVQMDVDPTAREGVDFIFTIVNTVLWLNRDKLLLRPDSFQVDPVGTVSFMIDPANQNKLGMIELMGRRLRKAKASPEQVAAILEMVAKVQKEGKHHALVANALVSSPFLASGKAYPEMLFSALENRRGNGEVSEDAMEKLIRVFNHPSFVQRKDRVTWLKKFLQNPGTIVPAFLDVVANDIRGVPWESSLLEHLENTSQAKNYETDRFLKRIFTLQKVRTHAKFSQWVKQAIELDHASRSEVLESILSKKGFQKHPDWSDWVTID